MEFWNYLGQKFWVWLHQDHLMMKYNRVPTRDKRVSQKSLNCFTLILADTVTAKVIRFSKWNGKGIGDKRLQYTRAGILNSDLQKEGRMFLWAKNSCSFFINLTVSHHNLKVQQSIEGLETLMTAKFTINNFYLEGTQSNKFSCHNGKCNYSNHVQTLLQSDIMSFLCKFLHALTIV